MSKDVLIILPAYNESNVISLVISDIKKQGYKNILVVDDCSNDNTFEVADLTGVIVLRHPINRGAGAATATGIEYAKRNDFDKVVLMDSDGQHSPKDISRLLKNLNNFDVVIGSRMIGNLESMPIQRKLANKIGSLVTFFFFGKFVNDSQSGFKAFNRSAIEKIQITFDRYEFCSEIIGEISNYNLTVKEVSINAVYSKHSMNKGHGQSIGNGFKMIMKFLMRS
jgi:glycosyltransferase involved in cell wall biosynthesis